MLTLVSKEGTVTRLLLCGGTVFDQQYPFLASWIIDGDGWIKLGQDDYSRSWVRILDIGEMIWKSNQHFETVDHALFAAEQALAQWTEEYL